MKAKTLVKSKIVLENDGKDIVIYIWKRTFWFFGYWYPFGNSSSTNKVPNKKISEINDAATSKVLFDKFISGPWT